MLSFLTKIQARGVAREAWMKAGCNSALAEELFRQHYEDATQEATNELLSLAWLLWQHWIDTSQSEPPVVCTADEPMGFDE